MNHNQLDAFYSFCDERGLARPAELLLRNRQWTQILEHRITNLSIDRGMLLGALSEYMTKQEYTQTVRWFWSHSEGDLESAGVEMIFTNHNGTRLTVLDFLTPQERQVFNTWLDVITIYRGCTGKTKEGLPWTLDHGVAGGVAQKRAEESSTGVGLVLTGQCRKTEILCYIQTDLNEHEVLVSLSTVTKSREDSLNS